MNEKYYFMAATFLVASAMNYALNDSLLIAFVGGCIALAVFQIGDYLHRWHVGKIQRREV